MTQPIDMAAIEKLRRDYGDTDGTFLADLVEAFFDEIRVFHDAARSTVGGFAQLGQATHRLKGVAVTIGATQVAILCRQLEAAMQSGQDASAADALTALVPALIRARVMLKRIVDSSGAA